MASETLAAAVTMVRDDLFFLERWITYYSRFFGRRALHIINHGDNPEVARLAEGCNVVAIPDVFGANFDALRWRFLSNFGNALRSYYNFVIINDVDEFVVVDPKGGMGLDDFLAKRRGSMTLTPIGLEVVHKADLEPESIGAAMLGPRRFVRYSSAYSKPCIFNHNVRISRGGHYATDPNLKLFSGLYLFHMRYVDKGVFNQTLARRAAQMAKLDNPQDTMISGKWIAENQTPDAPDPVFDLPVAGGFDFTPDMEHMRATWQPRSQKGLFAFDRRIHGTLSELPERFFGLV